MDCNLYPIFVKFVRLTHSNKELLTYLLTYLQIYWYKILKIGHHFWHS